MQHVSNRAHFPLLRSHSASYFGEHGRRQTTKNIENAMLFLEQNKSSKDKGLGMIYAALSAYPSSHGIEGELITEVYSLCLAEIYESFQSSEYHPTKDEFQISCKIVNLIQDKFPYKVSIKSDVLEQHFSYFAEMITEYNLSKCVKNSDRHFLREIHETFFRMMAFHIDISVRRDDFSSITQHKDLSSIFAQYCLFLQTKVHMKSSSVAHPLEKSVQSIFTSLIHFVSTFKDEIHQDRVLLEQIVAFVDVLVEEHSQYLPRDFQSVIYNLVDASLEMEFRTRYTIARNVHVALYFVKYIHEKKEHLIIKIEKGILSTIPLEHGRMPDFNELVFSYQVLFQKCDCEFQIQTLERIFRLSEQSRTFYFFLEGVIGAAAHLPLENTEKYILNLKKILERAQRLLLLGELNPRKPFFRAVCGIVQRLFVTCTRLKSDVSQEIYSLRQLVVDLASKIVLLPKIAPTEKEDISNSLAKFMEQGGHPLCK